MDPCTEEPKTNKRHSAYVPVHRRTGSGGGTVADSSSSSNGSGRPTHEYTVPTSQHRSSMSNIGDADPRRLSRQFAWTRQQQQQQQQQQHRYSFVAARYQDDANTEDSSDDPLTPYYYNNRHSSSSMIPTEKLSMALESMSIQDVQDWEELLRQYDRYEDMGGDVNSRRSSKRASRILDPFHEPPAEIPVVEEPTTILDCYDFPSAFKTHHLHDIFREYENMRGGYRIKWMDDTRALIIFEHPTTAKKAYIDNVSNPLAKIRPYNGPTDFLKSPPPSQQRRPVSVDLKRASYSGAYGARPERQSIHG